MLTYRDIRVKYAQTSIGFIWALINPLFQIIILSFIFGTVAKIGTGNVPVPHIIFTTAGMCGWTYFANVFSNAGASIIGAQGMISKIYFPRLIIPLSKAIVAFIDLTIILILLLILCIYYEVPISKNIYFLPFFILAAVLSGLTGGIWMSALTIRYRDFIHLIPFILRLGMYATPIAYPIQAVPKEYQFLFFLNPLTGIVEGIRWSFIGGDLHLNGFLISSSVILLLFVLSFIYFSSVEDEIVDII